MPKAKASDFADIFAVKEHDFTLGDPVGAKALPKPVEPRLDGGRLVGIVSVGDVIKVMYQRVHSENQHLYSYIHGTF